jgi:hypothetical protein
VGLIAGTVTGRARGVCVRLRPSPRRAVLRCRGPAPGMGIRRPGAAHAADRSRDERDRLGVVDRAAPAGARARRPPARPLDRRRVCRRGRDRARHGPLAEHVDVRPADLDRGHVARGSRRSDSRPALVARRGGRARHRAAQQAAAGVARRRHARGHRDRRPAAPAARPVRLGRRRDRARAVVAVAAVAGGSRLAAAGRRALDRRGRVAELAGVVGGRAVSGPARQPPARAGLDRGSREALPRRRRALDAVFGLGLGAARGRLHGDGGKAVLPGRAAARRARSGVGPDRRLACDAAGRAYARARSPRRSRRAR